jgi:DNA-binding GntR family transcriptional regulator
MSQQTYQALLDLISRRELEPGDVIEERRLAERFQVSRTPMRAAISRLLGEGILQQLANGLLVVREVDITEYLELLSIRRMLESEAAALAASRAPLDILEAIEGRLHVLIASAQAGDTDHYLDEDIHALIRDQCGNRSLGHYINDIHQRIRMRNLERLPSRLLPACQEHLALVAALKARDAEGARHAMIAHLDQVKRSFLESTGLLSN